MTSVEIGYYLMIISFGCLIIINLIEDKIFNKYKSVNANGFKYVDLNLPSGNLWAVSDVGAIDGSLYGSFFEFGNVKPLSNIRDSVPWEDSVFNSFSKKRDDTYIRANHDFIFDEKNVLRKAFDMVNHNMGGDWEAPTIEDFRELSNVCQFWLKGETVLVENSNVTLTLQHRFPLYTSMINYEFKPYFWAYDIRWDAKIINVTERNRVHCIRGVIHRKKKKSLHTTCKFIFQAFWINLKRKLNI